MVWQTQGAGCCQDCVQPHREYDQGGHKGKSAVVLTHVQVACKAAVYGVGKSYQLIRPILSHAFAILSKIRSI